MGAIRGEIEMPDGDPGAVRDGATALRRVAGGMDMVHSTVGRAASVAYQWDGLAAMEFHGKTVGYQHAARQADATCSHAAAILEGFAGRLEDIRTQVGHLQDQAEHQVALESQAKAAAAAASLNLQGATANLHRATAGALVDGGAAVAQAQSDISSAQSALGGATSRAGDARSEIERLKGKAAKLREDLDHDAHATANRLRALIGDLPTVMGGAATTVGGTSLETTTRTFSMGATVLVVTVSGTSATIKERAADGHWYVTLVKGVKGGVKFDRIPGLAGQVPGRLGGGQDPEGAFIAHFDHGERFQFGSEAAADEFIQYRGQIPNPHVDGYEDGSGSIMMGYTLAAAAMHRANRKKPVTVYNEGGADETITASGQERFGFGADIGRKRDVQTGMTTDYGQMDASATGHLLAGVIDPTHASSVELLASVTRAHDGTLTSATFTASAGGAAAKALAAETSGKATVGFEHAESHGGRVEREYTLDLHDDANRRAVEAVLRSQGMDPRANYELAQRLAHDARVDVRHYAVDTSSNTVSIGGEKAEGEVDVGTERTVLTGMSHRGPGAGRAVTDVG
jgi:hypothetical protein